MKIAETLRNATAEQAIAQGDLAAAQRGECVYVATLWNAWGYSYGLFVEVGGMHPWMPFDSVVVALCCHGKLEKAGMDLPLRGIEQSQ